MENEIPLISIKDMCKVYNPGENEVWALNHVSLEIGRGELVAIIGQSGSGKSTLMNMLGCLDVPTSGTYALNGVNVATLTDNQLSDIRNKEIGFIFQGFNLIPGLNAIENVEVPLFYRGVSKREQRELAVAALTQVAFSPAGPPAFSDVRRPAAACGHRQSHRGGASGDLGRRAHGKSGYRRHKRNPADFKRSECRGENGDPDYPRQ